MILVLTESKETRELDEIWIMRGLDVIRKQENGGCGDGLATSFVD